MDTKMQTHHLIKLPEIFKTQKLDIRIHSTILTKLISVTLPLDPTIERVQIKTIFVKLYIVVSKTAQVTKDVSVLHFYIFYQLDKKKYLNRNSP